MKASQSIADRASEIAQQIQAAQDRLAPRASVPKDVEGLVDSVANSLLTGRPEVAFAGADPYLALGLQQGALRCMSALRAKDRSTKRRMLRIGLEQMRQSARDIAAGAPVGADRPAKEIVQWLAGILEVTQGELADLIGTSERTLQRWLSPHDGSAPSGDDARRVRVVAQIANQLRYAVTGPGVIRWFNRPNPGLKGLRPAEVLEDPGRAAELSILAAGLRSSGAA